MSRFKNGRSTQGGLREVPGGVIMDPWAAVFQRNLSTLE